jgi:S-adenosylmethionine decarboxylase
MADKVVGFVTDGDGCYAGKHLLIDFFDIGYHGTIDEISDVLVEAAKATGATVLFHHFHPFDGGGVTGVIILAESHISIHTWILEKFISIDIFVCGNCDPYKAIPILENYFKPGKTDVFYKKRGIIVES